MNEGLDKQFTANFEYSHKKNEINEKIRNCIINKYFLDKNKEDVFLLERINNSLEGYTLNNLKESFKKKPLDFIDSYQFLESCSLLPEEKNEIKNKMYDILQSQDSFYDEFNKNFFIDLSKYFYGKQSKFQIESLKGKSISIYLNEKSHSSNSDAIELISKEELKLIKNLVLKRGFSLKLTPRANNFRSLCEFLDILKKEIPQIEKPFLNLDLTSLRNCKETMSVFDYEKFVEFLSDPWFKTISKENADAQRDLVVNQYFTPSSEANLRNLKSIDQLNWEDMPLLNMEDMPPLNMKEMSLLNMIEDMHKGFELHSGKKITLFEFVDYYQELVNPQNLGNLDSSILKLVKNFFVEEAEASLHFQPSDSYSRTRFNMLPMLNEFYSPFLNSPLVTVSCTENGKSLQIPTIYLNYTERFRELIVVNPDGSRTLELSNEMYEFVFLFAQAIKTHSLHPKGFTTQESILKFFDLVSRFGNKVFATLCLSSLIESESSLEIIFTVLDLALKDHLQLYTPEKVGEINFKNEGTVLFSFYQTDFKLIKKIIDFFISKQIKITLIPKKDSERTLESIASYAESLQQEEKLSIEVSPLDLDRLTGFNWEKFFVRHPKIKSNFG